MRPQAHQQVDQQQDGAAPATRTSEWLMRRRSSIPSPPSLRALEATLIGLRQTRRFYSSAMSSSTVEQLTALSTE